MLRPKELSLFLALAASLAVARASRPSTGSPEEDCDDEIWFQGQSAVEIQSGPGPTCGPGRIFVDGSCRCMPGFELIRDSCLPKCKNGKQRSIHDNQCKCRNGKVWKSGKCMCDSDSQLVRGHCKRKTVSGGTCAVKNPHPFHAWGKWRPEQSKCPSGRRCLPWGEGFSCMSRSRQIRLRSTRCGTCGYRKSGKCMPHEGWCQSGWSCSRQGSSYNCVEDVAPRGTRDCGKCGVWANAYASSRGDGRRQKVRKFDGRRRCRKKLNFAHTGNFNDWKSDASKTWCPRNKVCSPKMINGRFPCVHKSVLAASRKVRGPTPFNICKWSLSRVRTTLFATTSLARAKRFKPPHRVIVMVFKDGVYRKTFDVPASQGGWIYRNGVSVGRHKVGAQYRIRRKALISKTPRKSTQRGFSHLYTWGFPKFFEGRLGRKYHSYQLQIYAVNKDGTGYEVNCEETRASPIAIDLDRSGLVERIEGIFHFDLEGTGEKKFLKEWFAPTEGILVDDRFRGEITGKNLFGNSFNDEGVQYKDGFAKLSALYDKDQDGYVNGDELEGLKIWIDENSNARVDEGEISLLEDHGITQLSTTHDDFISTAELATGEEIETEDLWFKESESR